MRGMRLRFLLLSLLGCLMLCAPLGISAQSGAGGQEPATVEARKTGDAYTLPPETMKKAVAYRRTRTALGFVETGWGILQLLLVLSFGIAYRMRNVAVNLTKKRWGQGAIFVLELLIVTSLLNLPLELFGHHLAVAYGQSVQGWGTWFWDQAKSFALTWGIGLLLVMALFFTVRKYPKGWWLAFWGVAMGAVVAGIFASPLIIDPLFNKFEPLQASNPALVARLEQVVKRGGVSIPPERMYLMKASEKVTGLNAYVTGFGASKRVVVWDTSIAKGTPDEISFIFGHEMGHYVLNHIPKMLAFIGVVLLLMFYLGFRAVGWLIARYGRAWRVPTQNDWGALVVMVLVLSVLSFVTEPLINADSRMEEHEADVYGLEAIHGIVADPQGVGQAAFQLLGETSLADPHPSPFVVFWTYTHPDISSRAAFARDYNPWVAGQSPQFFKK
ncbi:peptidase M48, Ste24p [Granulicella sibirica]|uniref:Peptidase M48, Ste24p n=2 Tax=Granulicella sibirica TaxID=2479048 RepID=A0A4Q0T6R5_9BACT|nr:peptidase M48, Ste24p [Granulicella sibirica]